MVRFQWGSAGRVHSTVLVTLQLILLAPPPTSLGRILTNSISWIAPSTSYPSLAAVKSFLPLLGTELSGLIFFLSGNVTQSETVVDESSGQKMRNQQQGQDLSFFLFDSMSSSCHLVSHPDEWYQQGHGCSHVAMAWPHTPISKIKLEQAMNIH